MKQSSDEITTNAEHKNSQEHLPEEKKEPVGKKLTKAEQKKLDKERAEEAERKLKEEQEAALAIKKAQNEQMEKFKHQCRVKLDIMHAFGAYSGEKDFDVYGQVHIIGNSMISFDKPQAAQPSDQDNMTSLNIGGSSTINEKKETIVNQFKKLQLLYPIGRHIAVKSLDNQLMKFINLPKDVKYITAIEFNTKQNTLTVGVKNLDFTDFDFQNLSVYLYRVGPDTEKAKKQSSQKQPETKRLTEYTIRLTQGLNGIPPVEIVSKDQKKNLIQSDKVKYFQRYVSCLAWSADDNYLAVVVRNGPNESYVLTYDYIMRGKNQCCEKFDYVVNEVKFTPRDSQKLVVLGEGMFGLFGIVQKKFVDMSNYQDIPNFQEAQLAARGLKQTFSSVIFTQNDQIIACSESGDIFVIEIMQVVQVIDPNQLIQKGTEPGTRLKFNHLKLNSSGFVAATDDVLYFFKFKSTPGEGAANKGQYYCILKWRAKQFEKTKITSIDVYDNPDPKILKDSSMVISTKDNQIMYLNLYKQVYYPDYMQIQAEFKKSSGNKDALTSSDEESDGPNSRKTLQMIKSVGIHEEEQDDAGANKKKNKKDKEGSKEQREMQTLIDEIKYNVVACGFHQGEISCMDICIQRPIVATLSKADSTIRVWNYASGVCELVKSYIKQQEEFKDSNQTYLQSIALHPSGFYLAISFFDKVKIYHLQDSDIREYRVLDIKNQHLIKFSKGGQYLACVDQKDISIYFSYTLEKPKKYSHSGNISSLDFNDDDTIFTISSDLYGYIQKYDLSKGKAEEADTIFKKECAFNSCIFTKEVDKDNQMRDFVYTVGQTQDRQQMAILCYMFGDIDLKPKVELMLTSPFGAQKFTDVIEVMGPEQVGDEIDSKKIRAKNLVMSSDDGRLVVFGMPPFLKEGLECEVMNCHTSSIIQIKRSEDHKIFVTSGKDGTLFIYRVNEIPNLGYGKFTKQTNDKYFEIEQIERRKKNQKDRVNQGNMNNSIESIQEKSTITIEGEEGKKDDSQTIANNTITQHSKQDDDFEESEGSDKDIPENWKQRRLNQDMFAVIDERLQNIVMIEKQLMEEWRKQQDQLKLDMEKENNTVESSLRREKYMYEQNIANMEREKSDQLNKLNKEYEDLQLQEAEEKDENTQTMKKMELNHNQCKEELQSLYEKKLQMEQVQYNQLNQEKENLKNNYELEIKEMKKTNEQSIEKLLDEFKNQLQDVQEQYQNSKRTADGYKLMFEERLTQDEEQNKNEIDENSKKYAEKIKQLEAVIKTIRDDIETIKRQTRREQEEKDEFRKIKEIAVQKDNNWKKLIIERDKEIVKLEIEKKEVQAQLKKKETDLYGYKFKINDLQKTKSVLTHRTQEMKASLEPKEQQIENLKESLNNLEKVFKKQLGALKHLEDDVGKREAKKTEYKQKVAKEKERTKNREVFISQFVNDVHTAYESRNQDTYIEKLMDIYINYVSLSGAESAKLQKLVGTANLTDEILENKKKDPEVIEELDRQLQYMEKSIQTLKSSTVKIQSKQKLNINKRRQENNYLIKDLENVRQAKKQNQKELEKKKLEIQKKKLDKQKVQREFDKKLSQIEQETLQRVKQHGIMSNVAGAEGQDAGFEEEALYKKQTDGNEFFSGEQAQPSKVKGKIYKGTPFIRGSAEDKNKIIELTAQLEENAQQILMQKIEKRSLQEQIINLLDQRADNLGLTEDEKRAQLNELNISPFQEMRNFNDETQNLHNSQNQTFGGQNGGGEFQNNQNTDL